MNDARVAHADESFANPPRQESVFGPDQDTLEWYVSLKAGELLEVESPEGSRVVRGPASITTNFDPLSGGRGKVNSVEVTHLEYERTGSQD